MAKKKKDAEDGTEQPTVRINVDIGPRRRQKLDSLSEYTEKSCSEVIRSAIDVYHMIVTEASRGNGFYVRKDGVDTEVVITSIERNK